MEGVSPAGSPNPWGIKLSSRAVPSRHVGSLAAHMPNHMNATPASQPGQGRRRKKKGEEDLVGGGAEDRKAGERRGEVDPLNGRGHQGKVSAGPPMRGHTPSSARRFDGWMCAVLCVCVGVVDSRRRGHVHRWLALISAWQPQRRQSCRQEPRCPQA